MTEDVTGLATVNGGREATNNVVQFRNRNSVDDSTSIVNTEFKYEPNNYEEGQKYRTRTKHEVYGQIFVTVEPASREFLRNAFERIVNTIDSSLTQSERSNCFDEWKDLLKNLARKTEYFDSNHRKVLGTLISSTAQKDISDFSIQSLKVFIQNTNILRQPRITKPEARQAIKSLLTENIEPLIPLSVDNLDDTYISELDQMMANILEEDKRVHDKI